MPIPIGWRLLSEFGIRLIHLIIVICFNSLNDVKKLAEIVVETTDYIKEYMTAMKCIIIFSSFKSLFRAFGEWHSALSGSNKLLEGFTLYTKAEKEYNSITWIKTFPFFCHYLFQLLYIMYSTPHKSPAPLNFFRENNQLNIFMCFSSLFHVLIIST